jgi:hypothetical protein
MLRITDVRETMPDGSGVWTLKLEGNIQGEWVNELRRAWRAVRLAAAGAYPIEEVTRRFKASSGSDALGGRDGTRP